MESPQLNLPNDMLFYLFGFLGVKDLTTAGMVSKLWHAVAASESLWKKLFFDLSQGHNCVPCKGTWKQKYFGKSLKSYGIGSLSTLHAERASML